jgi:hypothetical protein
MREFGMKISKGVGGSFRWRISSSLLGTLMRRVHQWVWGRRANGIEFVELEFRDPEQSIKRS